MQDLQKEVERHYELLDEFSNTYDINDIQNCWTLKQYPMIIGEAISDGNTSIEAQQDSFINKLDAEKEQFQKEVAAGKETFKRIEGFNDIETLNEFFKEAATLNSNMEAGRDKVETFNMREARLNQAKSDWVEFDELRVAFDPFYQLLLMAHDSKRGLGEFSSQPLLQATFSYEEVEQNVSTWQK